MCMPCHLSCSECTGPNDNQCTKCATNVNRNSNDPTPSLNKCPCSSGFAEDVPLTNTC